MDQFTVFIVTLKEILTLFTPRAMAITLLLLMLVYRLPDIIKAVRWW